MSHRITVEGNFGSAEALKEVLSEQGIKFEEKKEGNDTVLHFPSHASYGNPLTINLTNPKTSSMDYEKGRMVGRWYRDAMAKHVQTQLLMQGGRVISTEIKGENIHLRVAVG